MTYSDRLRKRWVVVRLLPKMQRLDVGWFYQFSDADGYAKTLQRLTPSAQFEVMFDAKPPETLELDKLTKLTKSTKSTRVR